MEVYVLVEKRKSMVMRLLATTFVILGAVLFVVGALSAFLLLPGILLAGIGYFMNTRNYEYEYAYFDGEVRFAKIINKSKRKRLPQYTMNEVTTIAPLGDESLKRYEQQDNVLVRDYTSGQPDAKVYVMVVRGANSLEMIKFEPDERYLDEVCIKYRSKVVR